MISRRVLMGATDHRWATSAPGSIRQAAQCAGGAQLLLAGLQLRDLGEQGGFGPDQGGDADGPGSHRVGKLVVPGTYHGELIAHLGQFAVAFLVTRAQSVDHIGSGQILQHDAFGEGAQADPAASDSRQQVLGPPRAGGRHAAPGCGTATPHCPGRNSGRGW